MAAVVKRARLTSGRPALYERTEDVFAHCRHASRETVDGASTAVAEEPWLTTLCTSSPLKVYNCNSIDVYIFTIKLFTLRFIICRVYVPV